MGNTPNLFWKITDLEQPLGPILYPTNAFRFINDDQNPAPQSEPPLQANTNTKPVSTSADNSSPTTAADSSRVQHQPRASLPLDILIIGAGLGGLAAAIVLTLSGHKVHVLEAAPAFGEVGAGIQVPPNSTRHLLAWGVGPHIGPFISAPEQINIRRYQDGSSIGQTRLKPDFERAFGAPYWVLHRADYHAALLARARELGIVVDVDSEVASYKFPDDGSKASVILTKSTSHTADLIVAADGVKSIARTTILASHNLPPVQPESTSQAAYRATIPIRILADNDKTRWVTERPNQNLWVGPGRHSMTYAIGGSLTPQSGTRERLFNLVLSHPEPLPPDQWPTDPAQVRSEARRHFDGWDEKYLQILEQVLSHREGKIVKWPIVTIPPLPLLPDGSGTWTHKSGRLVLLGDSAHAMVPYMSQGAAMAVEDAAVIATVLSRLTSNNQQELRHALDAYEEFRRQRAGGMQQASWLNGEIWHLADGEMQRARDEAMGKGDRGWNSNQWSDEVCQHWTYGCDAVREVLKEWERGTGSETS